MGMLVLGAAVTVVITRVVRKVFKRKKADNAKLYVGDNEVAEVIKISDTAQIQKSENPSDSSISPQK
ncbi:MAG: hypothetical protein R3Y51_06405 [Rikenellaceae bacterium]